MNIIQLQPDDNVEQFSDDQLVMAHMTTHAYYREFRQGRQDQIEGWEMSDLVQKHDAIRQEMESRSIKHERINALDEESATVNQSADPENFEDPDENPDVSWMFQAQDFIETNDNSIELSEYVQLHRTPYSELKDWVQEWADIAVGDTDNLGLIAHQADGSVGAFLTNEGDEYRVYLNDVPVYQSEEQDIAADIFVQMADQVEDHDEPKSLYFGTFVEQQDWTVPDDPDEYSMADPDIEWSDVDTSLEAYMEEFGYDPDEDDWSDMADSDREEITRYHSASREGVPADTFGDLWGPHHRPDGDIVRQGVIAAKAANSGARSEPNTPGSLRDDIEEHLNNHLEEFAEEFEDLPSPDEMEDTEQATQYRVLNNATEDYKWYIWNKTEVEQWLEDQGYENAELERDGSYIKASIPENVQQAARPHERSEDQSGRKRDYYTNEDRPDGRICTTDQQGDGNNVLIRGAENVSEDFHLAVHVVGEEIEQDVAADLSEPLGSSGPYPEDRLVIPTSFQIEETIPDGARFFVTMWSNDAGSPGEPITDDDGTIIFDSGIYHHNPPTSDELEEMRQSWVFQNKGVYRSWRGSRTPVEEIDQESKPRRVVMNKTEQGSRVEAIEFPVRRDFAQSAAMVAEKMGFDKEMLEGLLDE